MATNTTAPNNETLKPAMLKSFWLMVPVPKKRCQDPSTQKRADDAHDDIKNDALLAIGSHDHAGHPPHEAACNEPNNQVHGVFLV